MIKLIGYSRVSSEGQRDNTSLTLQRDGIEKFCQFRGYELVDCFEDVEPAATIDNRIGFHSAMLKLACADGLVVYRLDRLTRSVLDGERLKAMFKQRKKLLLSVCDPIDLDSDEGDLFFTINTAFAQFERKRILARSTAGQKMKKELGKYYGGAAPYGWAPLHGKLVELPNEQKVIKQIQRLYLDGWNFQAIARHLNDQGIPTKRRSQGWRRDIVKRIIEGDTELIKTLKKSGQLLPAVYWNQFASEG